MRIWHALWNLVDYMMALILALMILLVFANVVMRYGFSSGLRQSVELSRLGLVWLVMLGAAVVLRRNQHLAISEFCEGLMPSLYPLLRRASYAVVVVTMLMLFLGAFKQMNANWDNISQITGLPSALFYLAGVISSVLMVFIGIVRVFLPDALMDDDRLTEEFHS
jgi:TRAP-type C4-dicarboxylate transport system permease small subunit